MQFRVGIGLLIMGCSGISVAAEPSGHDVMTNRWAEKPAFLFLDFNTEDLENHGRVVTASGPQYGPPSGGPDNIVGAEYDTHPAPTFDTEVNAAAVKYCMTWFGYKGGTSLEVTARQLKSSPKNQYVYRIKRLVCHNKPL